MTARTTTIEPTVPTGAMPEQIAHRYQILGFLAQGGQATLYEAKDLRTNARVALKVVDLLDNSEHDGLRRLMLEARIGSRGACEHLVKVFDAGTESATGQAYLAMELLEGTDLERLVERDGPIAPPLVVEYLRQIAAGLDFAHSRAKDDRMVTPIVHRDIKPSNLFVTRQAGGAPLLKILDFGIAKTLESGAIPSIARLGTPLYMAPEQVAGAPVSPAADIWALGLIAFFLLTGKRYWLSGNRANCSMPVLLREICAGATEPPSRRALRFGCSFRLPREFDEWFVRCVHRAPERRFCTAGEAVKALERAMRGAIERLESGEIASLVEVESANPDVPNGGVGGLDWRQLRWLVLGVVIGFVVVAWCGVWAIGNCDSVSIGRGRTTTMPAKAPRQRRSAADRTFPCHCWCAMYAAGEGSAGQSRGDSL